MRASIQLVLPGLFDLPVDEIEPELLKNELPGLNRLLRLATPLSNRAFSIDAILRATLALDSSSPESAAGLPLAQACSADEAGQGKRMVLFRAVHLQPDLHSAIIVPIHESEENLKDTRLIISDLKELFKVDCDIDVVTEGLYLMRLQAFDAPTHYPHLLSVLGRPANPYIEQSRRILPWYRLLNEMQMFMHQHEVNQDRMRRGLLSLNSLWFWGAGSIPTGYSADLAWYSDDALLNRFAASLGLDISPLDALGGLGGGNDVAVIDLRLIELLKTGFDMEPDQLLLDIEHRLLTPILAAARRDRRKLLLRAGYEYDYLLTSFSDLKFWRPTRNLAHWGEREFGL